jgi:ribosomal protein S27E
MENTGIDELIEARELEIECHACHATNSRTLGWLRSRHETQCDTCGELIVLGTADLRARMRNTERLLRALGDQLGEQLSHNLVGLSR